MSHELDDLDSGTFIGIGPQTPSHGTNPGRQGQASRPLGGRNAGQVHGIAQTGATVQTSIPRPEWDSESKPGVDLQPGTCIKQYELIRELGRGGMGVVYAARDIKLGRRVAMKFLRTVDREVVDRFLVEARATAQCNHDNIVIIYEVDEWQGMPYMVLEFLEGRSLRELIGPFNDGQPMPPSRVVELILPVARALARAHELGIVHRDLKPENVHVTNAGQVKVLDFGIAKALNSAVREERRRPSLADVENTSMTLTREGAMIGTLPYMSPEQMGLDEIDHRSDLFAVGLMMFEMLLGRHPVQPVGTEALVENLLSPQPMRSARGVSLGMPDGLAQAIDDCLVKQKADRIASANELARRLEHLLPGRRGRELAEGESPYPGLTAFQEHDADRFFGRSRDVARMVARVRELPLTGIVGPSGVGKSSFVRAGVGPALKVSGETWDVVTLRPGRAPIAALAGVVERLTTRVGSSVTTTLNEHEQLMERLRHEPGFLGATLRSHAAATDSHTLIFVDQFEELYTLVPDVDERRAFTAALAAVADDAASPLRVIVSMRSDFLDRVGEDPRFMEELSRGLVFLTAPDREGLREALEQPVEMVGYRFENATMVGDMLDALASTPGALPLLQFAAAKLWDARDRGRQLLTMQSYQAIGGISGALAAHADEVLASMSPAAQKLTQKVFRHLVTPDRTRAIVELSDLREHARQQGDSPDEIARVIDQLVGARLLVVQTRADAGGGSVEIVHESLIDRWPTLKRWLDEVQEDAAFLAQLSAAAKQWDAKGRPNGLLWRGEAMEEAQRWQKTHSSALPSRDEAFLLAVLALGRRGKRIRRFVLVGSFTVLAGIATAASVAYVQMSELKQTAQANAEEAKQRLADFERANAERLSAQDRKKLAEEQFAMAEKNRVAAQIAAQQAQGALGLSKEELQKANAELRVLADESRAARERAEAATRRALEKEAEAQKAKAALQIKLDAEQAKVKELEEQKRKLSTKLKDKLE
ncbi:MAG: serine/threonine-protein kinase [Kofleriaceae bacterium]|nr:serine/threonine-protein kinase [Kofleriaceae bacterium]